MRHRFVWLLMTLVVMLGVVAESIRAQETEPPGVDIVFVVDQSGSMSRGAIRNIKDDRCEPVIQADCPREYPADPNNLALKSLSSGIAPIFERMVRRAVERANYDFAEEKHRLGLVLFGDNAVAQLDLTPIGIERDPTGRLQPDILAKLPTEATNLGQTAFSRAFTTVCEMLNCGVPTTRQRVVVLLTDGQPAEDTFSYDNRNPAPYFSSLRAEHAALFDPQNVKLWVIGLDQKNQFWPTTASYWDQIAPGRTKRVIDPNDISATFTAIARDAIGEPPDPPRPCDGSTFSVDPYKAALTLILEYPIVDSKAEFTLPNDTKLTKDLPNVVGYTRSPQSETFVIKNPDPGRWMCQVVGGGVETNFRDIQGSFKLTDVDVERTVGSSGSTCNDFSMSVSYRDSDGQPVVEMPEPEYKLQQTATITIDGESFTRSLIPERDRADRWRLDAPLTPGVAGGEYPVGLHVRLASDPSKVLFSDASQSLFIDPKLPCMQILAPTPGQLSETRTRMSPSKLNVAVQLTQGGQPATPAGVFREGLDQIVTGEIMGPENIRHEVRLTPDPKQPGLFTAQVEGLQQTGAYTFTASLNATTQNGQAYKISGQPLEFRRVPGIFYERVMLALRVLAMLALLILVALFGYFVFLIMGPYPHGTLIFEQRTTGPMAEVREWDSIKSISLSGQRIFFGLFRTRYPTVKQGLPKILGIKKLKVRRITSGKEEGVSVIGVRDGKKTPLSFQFTKDKQYKTFDGNYRIKYENFKQR